MSVEVQLFAVTVPAGTAIAAPQTTPMKMPARVVDRIEVRVPPGPRGEVGWRIGSSGTQVLPTQLGTWLVTDDEIVDWPLTNLIDSRAWEFTAYNTGVFAHTITVRFLVTPPSLAAVGAPGADPVQLAGQALDQVPAVDQGPQLPDLPPLPPLPQPPDLPPLPPLPPLPSLGQLGAPTPPLRPSEDDAMRFATFTAPDGTLHYFALLSDGSIDHWWEFSDRRPSGHDAPPGTWLGMSQPFLYQGQVVIRGVGTDKSVWQTLGKLDGSGAWSDPELVLK